MALAGAPLARLVTPDVCCTSEKVEAAGTEPAKDSADCLVMADTLPAALRSALIEAKRPHASLGGRGPLNRVVDLCGQYV